MDFQNITYQQQGKTVFLTIQRESQLNALNAETISELLQAVKQAETDENVRGIILTGAGQKAFVAGADIKEFVGKTRDQAMALSRSGHELMDTLAALAKPVIAAINGFALGGGLELALSCHIRIAVTEAKLGLPEVSLGLIPGYGGTQRLTQLVGKGKAMEMILSGEMIAAQDARDWGLVNHVVAAPALVETAQELLDKIYSRSANAVRVAIQAVNAGLDSQRSGFDVEIAGFGDCFGSEEFKEGVAAFLEKRKPNF
ncbi:MAG: enoyl-CoA hydratase/isomerase family protein [Sphingobacterium sp.]